MNLWSVSDFLNMARIRCYMYSRCFEAVKENTTVESAVMVSRKWSTV